MSFNDNNHAVGYPSLQFKTDVALSDAGCNAATGAGCAVPPNGAAFYPFFSQVASGGEGNQECAFSFGNDLPNTVNDFGKDAQYGPFTTAFTVVYGNAGPVRRNPCMP